MPRNLGNYPGIHAGNGVVKRLDGKCHRKSDRLPDRKVWTARVKRWGKSPPPGEQSKGHGKPHRVQGQIGNRGAARSQAQARFRVRLLR